MANLIVGIFFLLFITVIKGKRAFNLDRIYFLIENFTSGYTETVTSIDDISIDLRALPKKGTTLPVSTSTTTEKNEAQQVQTPCPKQEEKMRANPELITTAIHSTTTTPIPLSIEKSTTEGKSWTKGHSKTKNLDSTNCKCKLKVRPNKFRKPSKNSKRAGSIGQKKKYEENTRRNLGPSIQTSWFREKIRKLSERKLRAAITKREKKTKEWPLMRNVSLDLGPKSYPSETFDQSLSVLRHSDLLMKISQLLKIHAAKNGNQEVIKRAEKLSKIANRKRDSALALMQTDLPRNMEALKRTEIKARDTLRMLRVLSTGNLRQGYSIPKESIQFDTIKTKESGLDVAEQLARFLAKSLAKHEPINIDEIVDSAISDV